MSLQAAMDDIKHAAQAMEDVFAERERLKRFPLKFNVEKAKKKIQSYRQVVTILEAAEKVNKKKSIEALNNCFLFLANHHWNTPDPDIIKAMNLLESLPDKE